MSISENWGIEQMRLTPMRGTGRGKRRRKNILRIMKHSVCIFCIENPVWVVNYNKIRRGFLVSLPVRYALTLSENFV